MLGLGIVLIQAIRLISLRLSAGNREIQVQAELA
jgi:hypothetical protein